MTVLADVGRQNMRWVLAGRSRTVMAVDTVTHNAGVVKISRQPGDGRVAILTDIVRADMRRMFAGSRNAIVTAHAIANDADMIEIRRYPRDGGVAVVASVAAGHMCRMFSAGYDTVVTRTASTNHLRVVDSDGWNPDNDAMTVLTDSRRLDVSRVLADRICTVVAARAVAHDIDVIKVRR